VLQPEPKMAAPAPSAMAKPLVEKGMAAKPTGPQPAVHLASYRSRKAAQSGWAKLKKAHRALLGKLEPEISKVNLGPGKGVFYRLKAGPVSTKASATSLCRKLKRRRQFCESSFMNAG